MPPQQDTDSCLISPNWKRLCAYSHKEKDHSTLDTDIETVPKVTNNLIDLSSAIFFGVHLSGANKFTLKMKHQLQYI